MKQITYRTKSLVGIVPWPLTLGAGGRLYHELDELPIEQQPPWLHYFVSSDGGLPLTSNWDQIGGFLEVPREVKHTIVTTDAYLTSLDQQRGMSSGPNQPAPPRFSSLPEKLMAMRVETFVALAEWLDLEPQLGPALAAALGWNRRAEVSLVTVITELKPGERGPVIQDTGKTVRLQSLLGTVEQRSGRSLILLLGYAADGQWLSSLPQHQLPTVRNSAYAFAEERWQPVDLGCTLVLPRRQVLTYRHEALQALRSMAQRYRPPAA